MPANNLERLAKRLGEQLASGPNRIALSTALRATMATTVPLALLPQLGLGGFTYPAVLGALATSLVDVGGPYRTRLIAMLAQALGGPCLLLLGSVAAEHWWVAAVVMAAIGILSGLIRALGPSAVSLGINMAIAFLVGVQIGENGARPALWVCGYGGGGLWTIVIALAFWHLRPYRRLEQEVAGAWEAVASLLTAAAATEDSSVISRRRREQRIAAAHAKERTAVQRARDSLGEMRAGTPGPGTTIAQLVVLLDAAVGVGTSAVTLCETAQPASGRRRADEAELAGTCRAVSRVLLAGKGELPLVGLRQLLQAAQVDRGEAQQHLDLLALTQALGYLEDAQEALRMLFGTRRQLPELLRLPFAHRLPHGAVLNALRTHATPRSAIFRHAMRVATVTAFDTALLVDFRLPHGIWLPLTSLAILQPDYGGTLTRAVHRTLGTIAGAIIAGALLATLRGSVGYDVALGVLLFAAFLLIRRNYGYGITFLTPIIILLIGMSSSNAWIDLAERVAYTVIGALLALVAGYTLWPQWERDQLRDRLASAIDADKAYIDAVLAALVDCAVPAENLSGLQRQAEIAVDNAEVSFQRTLAEPAHRVPLLAVSFASLIYLQRLCRHTIALSAQQRCGSLEAAPLERLRQLTAAILADVGRAVREARAPVAWPSIGSQLTQLTAQLASGSANQPGAAVATLLGHIVSDLRGLLSAAGYSSAAAGPSGRSLALTS